MKIYIVTIGYEEHWNDEIEIRTLYVGTNKDKAIERIEKSKKFHDETHILTVWEDEKCLAEYEIGSLSLNDYYLFEGRKEII